MNEEESLEKQLENLIEEICQHPQDIVKRQRVFNRLIRLMQKSGRIWEDSSPDYEDALQQTWLWFCKNLSAYDLTQASVITWFNNHLTWRLLDQRLMRQEEPQIFVEPVRGDGSSIIDEIPATERVPEENLLTVVCLWIENDRDGKFRGKHLRDRPNVNAQVVCLGRLQGKSWKDLATELDSLIPTLSGFWGTQCKPLIKELKDIPRIDEFLE